MAREHPMFLNPTLQSTLLCRDGEEGAHRKMCISSVWIRRNLHVLMKWIEKRRAYLYCITKGVNPEGIVGKNLLE